METQLAESQLALQLTPLTTTATAAADSQKAWHIFALLLSLGRPARLTELASKCTMFSTTPEYIQFLCEIPNSPLHLARNLSVTISSFGYIAIAHFVSNVDVNFTVSPQLGLEFEVINPRRVCGAENVLRTYYRKRKRIRSESEYMPPVKMRAFLNNLYEEEENRAVSRFRRGKENASSQAYLLDDNPNRTGSSDASVVSFDYHEVDGKNFRTSLVINSNARFFSSRLKSVAYEKEKDTDMCMNGKELSCAYEMDYDRFLCSSKTIVVERPLDSTCHHEAFHKVCKLKTPVVSTEAEVDDNNPSSRINFNAKSRLEADTNAMADTQAQTKIHAGKAVPRVGKNAEEREKEPLIDYDRCSGHIDKISIGATQSDRLAQENVEEKITMRIINTLPSLDEEKLKTPLKSSPTFEANMFSVGQKHLGKSPPKPKIGPKEALNCKSRAICKTLDKNKVINPPIDQQQSKHIKKAMSIEQKNIRDENDNNKEQRERYKENGEKSVLISVDKQSKHKELPCFESYIVEEEEGSGGYGTVYRARRKSDGLRFAIKCPHVNANRHHVQNEVKMLERFGGKNFVIKYEGSFKSGNSDCLVLEHVEHDRPEVLKREIDVFQLQWYGFCMFKALAGLHKQGIVHRDVKPGNFLFSRKANKGYLIDFNLAMDLHKKYGATERTKSGHDLSFNHVPLSGTKSLPLTRNKKVPTARALDPMNQEAGKISKSVLLPTILKRKTDHAILPTILKRKTDHAKNYTNINNTNVIKSQGADGSGITSAKDATSNRTPSAERLREPIPCQGRKELLSLVQEALQGASHESPNVPASKRKRIAAPPGNADRTFVHLSPMPLRSAGIPVAGAGLLKNKGDSNHKREGPCAGTKGFRAPEVLFRSVHQGPKVDIWSAGVTLLYLIMGRTPFGGDPDQNIKEITKVRGSEDLWEAAKLHNRESSFPADLFDIKYLPSVRLREWCKLNTRRPDFFVIIPASLFDLIDKCLTVNPRLRISAEEALRHEFFAPCHDLVRKHRLSRQGLSLDSGTTLLSGKQTQTCEEVS